MKTCSRKWMSETLLTEAERHPEVVVLTSDARGSATLGDFAQALPAQFVEAGIAEQNLVGVAAGMAACGRTAFVCAPAAFLSARALDQVKVDVAYSGSNVKLCGVSGGLSYGALGGSHHAIGDIAAMRPMQGLQVWLPCDGYQTAAMVRHMVNTEGPVYMRIGREMVESVYAEADAPFTPGKANVLRQGSDMTLIATGEMVWHTLQAAEVLAGQGVACRVLDMPTVKPLDEAAVVAAVVETGAIVTVEEHSIYGGLGAAVAEVVTQRAPAKMRVLGIPDEHVVAGEGTDVLRHYGLDANGIAKAALALARP